MKGSKCDRIPRFSRTPKGHDMGNIVGMIRMQATLPQTLRAHPSKYRRDQYIAIVYPFRGEVHREPDNELSSYRFLPVTEKVAMQFNSNDADRTIVPVSFHGNIEILTGGFSHNGGASVDAYLDAINTRNHPYKAGFRF